MNNLTQISQIIAQERKRQKIARQKAADDLGISERTLQSFEKGKNISFDKFIAYCNYLGIKIIN